MAVPVRHLVVGPPTQFVFPSFRPRGAFFGHAFLSNTIHTHSTYSRRRPSPRSFFCFHARCHSSVLQFCTCRKCTPCSVSASLGTTTSTRCRNRPLRFTEPGHSHREVERCGEAGVYWHHKYPSSHEGDPSSSTPILHSLGVFRTCLKPLSGQAVGKNSVLIWLNSKYLSHDGDGGCVVHVHMFSGFHEQHAVRCDQCGQIVLSKHICQPMSDLSSPSLHHQ